MIPQQTTVLSSHHHSLRCSPSSTTSIPRPSDAKLSISEQLCRNSDWSCGKSSRHCSKIAFDLKLSCLSPTTCNNPFAVLNTLFSVMSGYLSGECYILLLLREPDGWFWCWHAPHKGRSFTAEKFTSQDWCNCVTFLLNNLISPSVTFRGQPRLFLHLSTSHSSSYFAWFDIKTYWYKLSRFLDFFWLSRKFIPAKFAVIFSSITKVYIC